MKKKPNVIFCSGMTRSASRWSYQVYLILEKLRTPDKHISRRYLGEDDAHIDESLARALSAKEGAVVFTSHTFGKRSVQMVLKGLAKNLYTYHDPRDSIASSIRIDCQDLNMLLPRFIPLSCYLICLLKIPIRFFSLSPIFWKSQFK